MERRGVVEKAMKLTQILSIVALGCLVASTACSSDDENSAASSCGEAKKVADACNANKPADGGVSVSVNFKEEECTKAGDQGKKVADCIVANKSNCDCVVKCSLTGGTC